MATPRVLLIVKVPLVERLSVADRARLAAIPDLHPANAQAGAQAHHTAASTVRAALHDCDVRERALSEVQAGDADDRDLVVTVGGDGCALATGVLTATRDTLTVNSDPQRSVGHFTRFRPEQVAAALATWRAGNAHCERLHRLELSVEGATPRCFLNDCLVTSTHPAAVSRYVIAAGGRREAQISSGIWVSTAAGSTAGIRSAGMEPLSLAEPALLFKVREPYKGRSPFTLLEACQRPPEGLVITAAMPGLACWLDGAHRRVDLAYGSTATFSPCAVPLPLLVP